MIPCVAVEGELYKYTYLEYGALAKTMATQDDVELVNPFYTQRCFVEDLPTATMIFRHAIKTLRKQVSYKFIKPTMIVQPMEELSEGGCAVDMRTMFWIGNNCEVLKLYFYKGAELSDFSSFMKSATPVFDLKTASKHSDGTAFM